MNLPLLLYRISGWANILTNIFLAIYAVKTKRMWQGKYVFMAILFCFFAFINLISGITALFLIKNLFLDHIINPVNFVLKALFLREQHKNKYIRNGVITLIVVSVLISFFSAFYKDGYKEIGTLSVIINRTFFIIFSIFNLTVLFQNKPEASKLRQNPDFWFTATMLCFAFFGLISSIIIDISYKAGSDLVLYAIFITENLINIFIYFGYYKAMKLLR
jgi:hypothetical protein